MTPHLIDQLAEDRHVQLSRCDASVRRSQRTWNTDLAHQVADHGIEANEAGVQRLVRAARAASVLPIQTAVLADRSLPGIVRERALGHLLGRLLASPTGTSLDDAA